MPPLRSAAGSQPSIGSLSEAFFVAAPSLHQPSLHRTSLPPLQSSRLVVATATSVIQSPRPIVGFVHLFLTFIAGGIFFSSLLAGATTFFAVGKSNISRFWSLTKSLIHQVWTVFVAGLNEARLALRMDGKWTYREAWQVLKLKLVETRRAAAQGVDAIKAERSFYAGVVGQPGLITIQYFLNRLMPFSLTTQMENALKDSLKGVKNEFIRTITLEKFDTGDSNPQLLEARNYELGKDALAFDVDVKWESNVYAKMKVTTKGFGLNVPVTVQNLVFIGTARVEMTPLTPEPPGWGAILVSLPSVPKIGLSIDTVGTDLTKVPWLKREIMKGLQKSIEDQLLWPKRLVLPSLKMPLNNKQTILSKSELDLLATSDPLLQAEITLEQQVALKEHMNSMKPNITAVSSNLQVSVGDEDVHALGAANSDAASNVTDVKRKKPIPIVEKENSFMKFIRHTKTNKTEKSSDDDASMADDHDKNGAVDPNSGEDVQAQTDTATTWKVMESIPAVDKKKANPFLKLLRR